VPSPAATAARPEATSLDCALIAEPGEPIATVALLDRIDPAHAPRPSNESEHLLFRQLYETLIRLDCKGRIRPGLAESWRLDADGRTWILTLRADAHFSDGSPVTSSDVRSGWMRDGAGDELQSQVSRLVQSIVPIDDRTLAITLKSQRVDMPVELAHPDLAIAKSAAGSRWPIGTRTDGAAPDRDASPAADSAITVRRDNLPSLRFVVAAGDPRDVLDKGFDLLLTRDPAALEYAATLPHFQSVPLEWHRVHVFVTPGRARGSPSLPEDARRALAGDAVRGEARGAAGPFWWQTLQGCEVAPPEPRRQGAVTPRLVYDGHDGAASDLAQRLVGLARGSTAAADPVLDLLLPDRPRRTYQRAAALTGEPLAATWRRGLDAGYIISLDRRPLDPCRDIHVLMDGARWLDPETIVPLVETRLRAIVRRGRSGVTREWDGGLLIADVSGPG
jgi:hypothetical protein